MKAVGKASFDEIYEKNVDNVYRAALHYSDNHHVAEEITQIIFMKLYMNIENINTEAVSSWLLTSAKHMALNYNRSVSREIPLERLDEKEFSEEFYVESSEDEAIKNLENEKYEELTKSIFSKLYGKNPKWYDAVIISYYLGKPQKEVAEIMGIKLDVLHSMLYRAKRWIRKHYKKPFERDGE